MRLILSTILAAALVFGGTLLFAGYLDGLQVRDEKGVEEAEVPLDEREVHYCPQAEDLIDGSVPDHFVTQDYLAHGYQGDIPSWSGAALLEPYEETALSVASVNLRCSYFLLFEGADGFAWYTLELAPGFLAELDFRTLWKRMEYYDSDQEFIFECEDEVQQCGFFLLAQD